MLLLLEFRSVWNGLVCRTGRSWYYFSIYSICIIVSGPKYVLDSYKSLLCSLKKYCWQIWLLCLQRHSAGENMVKEASSGESVVPEILNGLTATPSLTFCWRYRYIRCLLWLVFMKYVYELQVSVEIIMFQFCTVPGKGALWSWGWGHVQEHHCVFRKQASTIITRNSNTNW